MKRSLFETFINIESCLKMGGGVSAVATTEFKRRLSRGSLLHADAESIATPPFYIKDAEISEDDQERIRYLANSVFFRCDRLMCKKSS